jgi:hypothetical protein
MSCKRVDCTLTMIAQLVLTVNDIIITIEFATGYVSPVWDDRMHILIDTTSCLTLLGQSISKTAFAVTLLKLTKGIPWQQGILWFCIVTMMAYNLVKVSKFGKSISLVSIYAHRDTADGLRMEPCLRRTGESFRLSTGHLPPQRPLGRLQERRKW